VVALYMAIFSHLKKFQSICFFESKVSPVGSKELDYFFLNQFY
jgi:hypothetical protein